MMDRKRSKKIADVGQTPIGVGATGTSLLNVVRRKEDEGPDAKKQRPIAVAVTAVTPNLQQRQIKNDDIKIQKIDNTQYGSAEQIQVSNAVQSAQPVYVSVRTGETLQLPAGAVIVYSGPPDHGGNTTHHLPALAAGPSQLSQFTGNILLDSSGRLLLSDSLHDYNSTETNNAIAADKNDGDIEGELMQYSIKVDPEGDCYVTTDHTNVTTSTTDTTVTSDEARRNMQRQQQQQQPQQQQHPQEQQYEIVQIVNADHEQVEPDTQENLSDVAGRWLNVKYDFIVRKLQFEYDAGVKLLHSSNGILRCVYFTTPAMQLAFNSVPQFLCFDNSIEFTSSVENSNGQQIRQQLMCMFAEDGNGQSMIVSAGISTLGDNVRWFLDTFKTCNPAWKQVRCVVVDPDHHVEAIRWCFPDVHICCNTYQAVRWAASQVGSLTSMPTIKSYVQSILKDQVTDASTAKVRRLIGNAVNRLPRLVEGDNFTNVLHKELEKILDSFAPIMQGNILQPDEFVPFFFEVVRKKENDRQSYALSRLQDTVNCKQSPMDTITQYAYYLIHQQTSLAQKTLSKLQVKGEEVGPSLAIYNTSIQECNCLFSRVFRLPCRHILMLTTELKVKTHIPFEPRWTVHHCLFGCETDSNRNASLSSGTVSSQSQQITNTSAAVDNTIKHPQYIMSSGETQPQQVIFCTQAPAGTQSGETIQYLATEMPGQVV